MLLLFRYEFRAAFTVENIYDNKRNDIYYGENLNSSNREIDIDYDKEIAFAFAIFTCWSLFIAVRYYGYVLLPEYSNLNKELRFKVSRKTIYLSFCTLIAESIVLWWCWPILAYVIDIILCYL